MLTRHIYVELLDLRYNYPKEIVDEELEKGDAVFYQIQDDDSLMVACKYRATKDKSSGQQKVVYMLSTCHQPSMEIVNNDHSEIPVLKPVAVKQYNTHGWRRSC